VFDASGARVGFVDAPLALCDEQETVPPAPSHMNSMYFDEIYHGRTAYEYVRELQPYENSHPPLGKMLISIGISLFGMTPFGWRIMGALFGVAMLPAMYVLLKNMFGKRVVAICGTLLLGFDFMRFVQTRIATIDTFAVFFILLSYLFMFRFIAQPHETPFHRYIRPLALSGLFFGIGCASKWVVVYAGFGLAALYFIHLVTRYRYFYVVDGEPYVYTRRMFKLIPLSFLFFVVSTVVIYCACYIPYGVARGMVIADGMLWDSRFYGMIWDNQVFMYTFHSGMDVTHAYSSHWWQWILNLRPILFYRHAAGGSISTFSSFGNPAVWWGGLVAIGAMALRAWHFRDSRALVVLLGYLSQTLPWLFISRIVFIYHYFPSTLFLILALAHVFDTIMERQYLKFRRVVYAFTGAVGGLFALFYPALTGIAVPWWYARYVLEWLPSWPFH
jgi:dolichyl-phosphate-mannose--protein O-mannosyl transferase